MGLPDLQRSAVASSLDMDRGIFPAIALHQRIKDGRIGGMEAHAAMGGGAAQRTDVCGAVNGNSAVEEDRIGHRRIVVFARMMIYVEPGRTEIAHRRTMTCSAGRH